MTRKRVFVLLHLSVDLHIRIVQETIKKIACVAREGVGRLDWKDPVCTLILMAPCLTLCNPTQVGVLYSDPQEWSIVFLLCPQRTWINPSCSPLEQTGPAEACLWSHMHLMTLNPVLMHSLGGGSGKRRAKDSLCSNASLCLHTVFMFDLQTLCHSDLPYKMRLSFPL